MIRRHIPNLVTLCNLTIGVLSVYMALSNRLDFAAELILLAAILDFLDGFLARILDAASPLGKQLDSFADLVSFGLAPSALASKIMEYSLRGDIFQGGWQDLFLVERFLLFSPFLLVLFAALRLAEFNLQKDASGFTGLPTPATAIFIAGATLGLVPRLGSLRESFLTNPIVLLAVILGLSLLMVSRIPMFSLKFPDFRWKGNRIRYFFLAVSGILLIILQEIALPVIILFYLLLSIVDAWIPKSRK